MDQLQRGARFDYYLRMDSLTVSSERSEKTISAAKISYQLGSLARTPCESTEDKDEFDIARKLFPQALDQDPPHTDARGALGWSPTTRGDWVKADSLVQRAMRESPDDPAVALEVGRVHLLRSF